MDYPVPHWGKNQRAALRKNRQITFLSFFTSQKLPWIPHRRVMFQSQPIKQPRWSCYRQNRTPLTKWHPPGPLWHFLKPPTINKVNGNSELGPWLDPHHSCLWFKVEVEGLGSSLFRQSKCCRGCTPAGTLRLPPSTWPGRCQRGGRWPAPCS